MSKYLDQTGLLEVWQKIKETYITQEEVDAKINSLIDNAPVDFDTLKEISDWIETQYGINADIQEQVNKQKAIILPVSVYGFDTNLRNNQIVNGKSLVQEVLKYTNETNRQVIIKSGDYKYNVASVLTSQDYQGFTIINMDLNPIDENPIPALEKGVFLYSVALDKTFTFYEKAFTNAELKTQINNILISTLVPISSEEIDEICTNNN